MERSEAIAAIRSSIDPGSVTPTLGPDDRETCIRQKAIELEKAVVEPVVAVVHGVAHEHGLLDLLRANTAFVIARSGESWLGYVPAVGEFFLAYGRDPNELNALGFHSNDALAEWLG